MVDARLSNVEVDATGVRLVSEPGPKTKKSSAHFYALYPPIRP